MGMTLDGAARAAMYRKVKAILADAHADISSRVVLPAPPQPPLAETWVTARARAVRHWSKSWLFRRRARRG